MSLIDDLRERVRDRNILVVVGAGVTIGAGSRLGLMKADGQRQYFTPSWTGFLEHGLEYCKLVGDENHGYVLRINDLIKASQYEEAANLIRGYLNGVKVGLFDQWIKESIGKIKLEKNELPRAILKLNCRTVTTNYDDLFTQYDRRYHPITWEDRAELGEFFQKNSKSILHMHGFWKKPNTIVLDEEDYKQLTSDQKIQDGLESLLLTNAMLMVGCGATVADPTFSRLLKFVDGAIADLDHFILCLESEYAQLSGKTALTPIIFGKDYADLPAFLNNLSNGSITDADVAVTKKKYGIWYELDREVQMPALRKSLKKYTVKSAKTSLYATMGELGQGHRKLSDRFMHFEINPFFEEQFGNMASAEMETHQFPSEGTVDTMRTNLLYRLFGKDYYSDQDEKDLNSSDLVRIPRYYGSKFIVLQHIIDLSGKMRPETCELIKWYATEFWKKDNLKPSDPACFVFLHFRIAKKKGGFLGRFKFSSPQKELSGYLKSITTDDRYQRLEELTPVNIQQISSFLTSECGMDSANIDNCLKTHFGTTKPEEKIQMDLALAKLEEILGSG